MIRRIHPAWRPTTATSGWVIRHSGNAAALQPPSDAQHGVGRGNASVHSGRVGELWQRCDVPGSPDAGITGAHAFINDHTASIVGFDPSGLQPQAVGVGYAAKREQHPVELDEAPVVQIRRSSKPISSDDPSHASTGANIHTISNKSIPNDFLGLLALFGHDVFTPLDDRDCGPQPRHGLTHLAAHASTTDEA